MRKYLIERDEVCRICGEDDINELTRHHIFPKKDKRRDKTKYHTLLCRTCHDFINQIWVPKFYPKEVA